MEKISATLVKTLRDRTGAGIMECRKALVNSKGDIELSIDFLRKSGIKNAKRKVKNVTNQGAIFIATQNNIGLVLEMNSETDFVSRSKEFKSIGNKLVQEAIENKILDLHSLQVFFEKKRSFFISQFSENISIRQIKFLHGNYFGKYIHDSRIGVLLSIKSSEVDEKFLNQLAMHIAANEPEYMSLRDIPKDVINRERNIQHQLSRQKGKSDIIIKKILEGRMKNYVNDVCFFEQPFILDNSKKVKVILSENNILVNGFIRLELGS